MRSQRRRTQRSNGKAQFIENQCYILPCKAAWKRASCAKHASPSLLTDLTSGGRNGTSNNRTNHTRQSTKLGKLQRFQNQGYAHCHVSTFVDPLAEGYPIQHHATYQSFSEALAQGCWICVQLDHFAHPKLRSSNFEALSYQLSQSTRGEEPAKSVYRLSFRLSGSNFYFVVEAVRPWTRLHSLAETSKLQAWTGDQSIAELAKGWLKHCQEQHRSCSQHVAPNWYPSRLLDISQASIRLRHTSKERVSGPYATLSHCWGTERFWVLCTETLPELVRGVPLSSFPTTFQQAIITARRLGIQYLWIDSYCILQGSDLHAQADWEREAARMGQVYSNSLINIGAAQASGPGHGFFSPRNTQDLKKVAVQWRPFARDEEEFYYVTVPGIEFSFDQVWHRLHGSPLAKRGWVIQESVLSPRMISFNGPEIFWQCSELAACGNFPDNNSQLYSPTDYPFWTLTDFDGRARRQGQQGTIRARRQQRKGLHMQLLERWAWLMASYCLASLTFPDKDVFKALEGVGQRVAQLTDDVYQHGLLAKSLPQALLWSAPSLSCRASPPQRAPSWHWASCEGHQSFQSTRDLAGQSNRRAGHLHTTPLAYVFMSTECKTFASSPTTDLWPSLLCIGRLMAPSIERKLLEKFLLASREDGRLIHYIAIDRGADDWIGVRKDPSFDRDRSLEGLSYLPLVGIQRVLDARSQASTAERQVAVSVMHGLILQQRDKGTFRRVGTFKVEFRNETAMLLERLRATRPRLIELE